MKSKAVEIEDMSSSNSSQSDISENQIDSKQSTTTNTQTSTTTASIFNEDEDLGSLGESAFSTFSMPTTIQVGHFIPLRCGHNGNFLPIERKVYEKHLFKGGMLSDDYLRRMSDSNMFSSRSAAQNKSIDLRPSLFWNEKQKLRKINKYWTRD